MWGSLKRYLRDYHNLRNQATLIEGIKMFWRILSPTVCRKYIKDIKKVTTKVIKEKGCPSGYNKTNFNVNVTMNFIKSFIVLSIKL